MDPFAVLLFAWLDSAPSSRSFGLRTTLLPAFLCGTQGGLWLWHAAGTAISSAAAHAAATLAVSNEPSSSSSSSSSCSSSSSQGDRSIEDSAAASASPPSSAVGTGSIGDGSSGDRSSKAPSLRGGSPLSSTPKASTAGAHGEEYARSSEAVVARAEAAVWAAVDKVAALHYSAWVLFVAVMLLVCRLW